MNENFLTVVGRAIIPKKVRPNLRLYVMKAGYEEVPYSLLGVLFFISAGISYALFMGFFYRELKQYGVLQFGFLSFVTFAITMFLIVFVCGVLLYFRWNLKTYARTKELESLLPDYLTLVSTNLKGGMSFENALWNAIKPEFGILANEIGLVSKRVMTGNDVSTAMIEFSMKYDSPTLRRNIQLMIGEIESGGKIVSTIDKIIENMKKTEALKREMSSNTVTYMMFIGSLVIVIAPVLFALSLQLFTITTGFVGNIAGSVDGGIGQLQVSAPTLDRGDFKVFSVLAISVISIFSSIIIAIIEKGNVRSGIKYIPMFLVTSLTVYFIAAALFTMLFGGIALG